MFFRTYQALLKILEGQFWKGLWGGGIGFGFKLMCPCSGGCSWRVAEPGEGVGQKAGYCGIYPQTAGLQWPMIHHQQMKLVKDSDKLK